MADTASKTSASGISVGEDCVQAYRDMKLRSTHKWITFKIDDAGSTVVVDQLGPRESTLQDLVAAFPGDSCKYAVLDFPYAKAGAAAVHKLVFLHWAPDTAAVKTKLVYASTKDFFKHHLDGLCGDFHVTDASDISEKDITDHLTDHLK